MDIFFLAREPRATEGAGRFECGDPAVGKYCWNWDAWLSAYRNMHLYLNPKTWYYDIYKTNLPWIIIAGG
jgi:hypothetical protein